jgi:voltage-dependent calcium channel T type alpha-1G
VVELCQSFLGDREGGSGLSVLRTFRLLRILKLVRFMPNLRRQLFVMLRTMDNVAVFFALLILFIFIFRYVSARKTPLTSAPKTHSTRFSRPV